MRIDILYVDGCPNHRATTALVHEVARSLGLAATVREVAVQDAEEAVRLRFFGSPTVQVNGRDIDPTPRSEIDCSLSCRLYGSSGSPSRALVEDALRGAAQHPRA